MAIVVLCSIILITLIWFENSYSKLIRLRNDSDEAFYNMDEFFKKRHDVISELLKYANVLDFPRPDILANIIEARENAIKCYDLEERSKNENLISSNIKSLIGLSKNWEKIISSERLVNMSEKLENLENSINIARTNYNETIKEMNSKFETMPYKFVAKAVGFKRYPYFLERD